jgi:hypothetical protein
MVPKSLKKMFLGSKTDQQHLRRFIPQRGRKRIYNCQFSALTVIRGLEAKRNLPKLHSRFKLSLYPSTTNKPNKIINSQNKIKKQKQDSKNINYFEFFNF